MRRLQQAEKILGLVAEVRAALDSGLMGWARGNLDDMQAQLEALVPAGFLRDVPAPVLAEYPRYLKAIATRARRALDDPARDQQRMLEIKPFADALARALAAGRGDERAGRPCAGPGGAAGAAVRAGTRREGGGVAEKACGAPGGAYLTRTALARLL